MGSKKVNWEQFDFEFDWSGLNRKEKVNALKVLMKDLTLKIIDESLKKGWYKKFHDKVVDGNVNKKELNNFLKKYSKQIDNFDALVKQFNKNVKTIENELSVREYNLIFGDESFYNVVFKMCEGLHFYKIMKESGVARDDFLAFCHNKRIAKQNQILKTVERGKSYEKS